MADEVVRINLDDSGVKQAVDSANKGLESIEKTASTTQASVQGNLKKTAEEATKTGEVLVSVSSRTSKELDRATQRFLQSAKAAGQSKIEQIESTRDRLIQNSGGKVAQIDQINAAADKLIKSERLREFNADLARAQAGTAEAAKGAQQFARALAQVNKEAESRRLKEFSEGLSAAQRGSQMQNRAAEQFAAAMRSVNKQHRDEQAAIEAKVKSLEKEAALKGKTGVARVQEQRIQFLQGSNFNQGQIDRINKSFDELAQNAKNAEGPLGALGGTFGKLVGAIGLADLATGAIRRIGSAIVDFGKESILYAARTEQLFYAQNAVARGSNISTVAVEKQVQAVRALGITIQDARLGVTRMIATNMDFTRSAQLARVAQDLGRVAGITTAEAFERLVHATVTAQPELLRALGLNVSFEQSYARFARQIGTTADALTVQQKAQVALNAVLDAGRKYTGAYEESQKTAGGQLLSMERYILDVKQALGEQFLPALTQATAGAVNFVKELPKAIEKGRELLDTVLAPLAAFSDRETAISVVFRLSATTGTGTALPFDALNVVMGILKTGKGMADQSGVSNALGQFGSSVRGLADYKAFDVGGAGYRSFYGSPGAKNPILDANATMDAQMNEWDTRLGGKVASDFMERQKNTAYGVEQRLSAATQARTAAYQDLAKAAQSFAKSGRGDAMDAMLAAEKRFISESRNVAALEAQKKAFDDLKKKAEEYEKIRQKGAEYQGNLMRLMGPNWGRSGIGNLRPGFVTSPGLEGSDFEVKPAKIDSIENLNKRVAVAMEESKRARDFENETLKIQNDTDEARLKAQEGFVTRRRDLELLSLQGVMAVTVEQKMAVEQRRYEIVKEALDREAALKAQSLERQKSMDMEYLDWLALIYPERTAEISQRRAAIGEQYAQKGAELESQWITDGAKL